MSPPKVFSTLGDVYFNYCEDSTTLYNIDNEDFGNNLFYFRSKS